MSTDAQKSSSEREFRVEMHVRINMSLVFFFWKVAIVLDDFKVMGSSLQILDAVTEKARLPKLNLVL